MQTPDPEPLEPDPELDAALDRADAEIERGETRQFDEVAAELRRKYLSDDAPPRSS